MTAEGRCAARYYLRWARAWEQAARDAEADGLAFKARKARFTAKVLRRAAFLEMTDPEVLRERKG